MPLVCPSFERTHFAFYRHLLPRQICNTHQTYQTQTPNISQHLVPIAFFGSFTSFRACECRPDHPAGTSPIRERRVENWGSAHGLRGHAAMAPRPFDSWGLTGLGICGHWTFIYWIILDLKSGRLHVNDIMICRIFSQACRIPFAAPVPNPTNRKLIETDAELTRTVTWLLHKTGTVLQWNAVEWNHSIQTTCWTGCTSESCITWVLQCRRHAHTLYSGPWWTPNTLNCISMQYRCFLCP